MEVFFSAVLEPDWAIFPSSPGGDVLYQTSSLEGRDSNFRLSWQLFSSLFFYWSRRVEIFWGRASRKQPISVSESGWSSE
jgi:hypothetical protein